MDCLFNSCGVQLSKTHNCKHNYEWKQDKKGNLWSKKNQLTVMMFIKVMDISLHVSCDPTITRRKEKEIYFAQSIITSTTYLYQEMLPPL